MRTLAKETFEPVAPYVTPHTPKTRNLTPQEAHEILQRDWLYQASGNPTPGRIKREIKWARQLADRIASNHAGQVDFSADLAQLGEIEKQLEKAEQPDHKRYFRVRRIKRAIQFRNPVIDFDKML